MPDEKSKKRADRAKAQASRRPAVMRRAGCGAFSGSQRPCLAGQRDRPPDRARRLSARHHPAQRGQMGRDLQCQPLGGARSHQDADGQEPAGIAPQDRQLGRAEGTLEPARPRRAGLVRDRARPRGVPAHRAGVPPHHRAGSVGLCRHAAQRRADGRDQPGLPRDGRGDEPAGAHPRRYALSSRHPARLGQRSAGAARRADRVGARPSLCLRHTRDQRSAAGAEAA